jgi:hypothetical protein
MSCHFDISSLNEVKQKQITTTLKKERAERQQIISIKFDHILNRLRNLLSIFNYLKLKSFHHIDIFLILFVKI